MAVRSLICLPKFSLNKLFSRGLFEGLFYISQKDVFNARVQTSHDGWVWENEANYDYYKHGPLVRAVIGQQQVHGVGYVYTVQGWINGVNGTQVGDGSYDMGEDGKTGSAQSGVVY